MPQGRGYPSSGSAPVHPSNPGKPKGGQPDAAGPKAPRSSRGKPAAKSVTRAVSRSNAGGTYPVTRADA